MQRTLLFAALFSISRMGGAAPYGADSSPSLAPSPWATVTAGASLSTAQTPFPPPSSFSTPNDGLGAQRGITPGAGLSPTAGMDWPHSLTFSGGAAMDLSTTPTGLPSPGTMTAQAAGFDPAWAAVQEGLGRIDDAELEGRLSTDKADSLRHGIQAVRDRYKLDEDPSGSGLSPAQRARLRRDLEAQNAKVRGALNE